MSGGTTYYIRVSGYNGATGIYRLKVTGGGGVCSHPYDATWFPQEAGPTSIMEDAWGTFLPHPSAWAKIHLGFTRPLIVEEDGTYTLHRASTVRSSTQQISEPEALVIVNPGHPDPSEEYFVLENRALISRTNPANVYEEGLAVWLIREPFPGDTVLISRRSVRLLRPQYWAANSESLWDGADPEYYDLTPRSAPRNTNWTDGTVSYVEILNMSAAGSQMTVDIRLPGVFVDGDYTGPELGTPDQPYDAVYKAVLAVSSSGRRQTIRTAPGTYPENGLYIDTPCTLTTWGEGTVYIGQ
jgi:hypothetical protein